MKDHPAYKYCIRILSKRDYSRAKIKQKLIDKDYEDVADELIELLVEKRYLREGYYVESRITGMMRKNYSPSYILSKLKEEKAEVSLTLINEIFEESGFTSNIQIEDLIRKKSLLHNWIEEDLKDPKNKVKLARFVISKGHFWEETEEFF